jgi:hypothetical protein
MEHLVYEMQRPSTDGSAATAPAIPKVGSAVEKALLVLLWLIVGGPMLWGVLKTLQDVQYLFQ